MGLGKTMSTDDALVTLVMDRLGQIESLLANLVNKQAIRDWYSTREFGNIVGRAEGTVRDWCRKARLHAKKRNSGRGSHCSWAISHEELVRFERDGLLPSKAE